MAATKTVEIAGIGQVVLTKRSGSRNLRLSVRRGKVYVSMPQWSPFATAIKFATGHTTWIQEELQRQEQPLLEPGQKVGKLHHLRFEQVLSGQHITARVTATEIIVRMCIGEQTDDAAVQQRAVKACIRALKREAAHLLPARLEALAVDNGLSYRSVQIKNLKRRWGSCDNAQTISLNLFLMELSWTHIDYVLLHELTHTKHMNHSADFWELLIRLCPDARTLSKQLRIRQPGFDNGQT